tara:strand:+ start:1777 stop:2592 length:816 start_codon:yes stop_codon:yes gene_type:complete
MIYDCFSYWDEDLLLDLRLNILNDHVDYFVILEGNKTWQNNPKKLRFNIEKYDKFYDKIIYRAVEDLPDGNDPYLRENHQRNSISKALVNSKPNDIIMISDLDEIPNPDVIKNFKPKMRYAAFKQKNFNYKLNLLSTKNPIWMGTKICLKKYLKSPQWLRELKFKKRPFWRLDKFRLNNILENGGWHFCNLKTPEQLLYKYQNLCETNDPIHFKEKIEEKFLNTDSIRKKISLKEDILGRNDSFVKVYMDDTYPNYILNNLPKYQKWIEID